MKLQQVDNWLDALILQEPNSVGEIRTKRQVTRAKTEQTLHEISRLVQILARGCQLCKEE